jgi:hypothetical protein
MRIVSTLIAGGVLLSAIVPASAKEPPNLGPVRSGAVSDMNRGYGRAGGLTSSQRVEESQQPAGRPVRSGVNGQAHVLATWDELVAKRTHMPLAASAAPVKQHPYRAPRKPHY